MIRKFQLGGQQEQALMLFVQGLALTLQADPQLIVQIAQLNPEALQVAVLAYQLTQDMGQAALAFLQALQLKTQAAKHGTKLQYLKSLKHQCAEDEELVYYKKGGSVTCGCKKKENGGEVTKAQESWKSNFKNRKKNEKPTIKKCGGAVKKEASGSKVVKTFKDKCGAKMKKHQLGGSLNRIPFIRKVQ